MSEQNGDSKKTMYLSLPLLDLVAEKEFPGSLYLCLHHKMVRYRNKGDKLTTDAFDKLVFAHVRYLFIEESERGIFQEWIEKCREEDERPMSFETTGAAEPGLADVAPPEGQPPAPPAKEQLEAAKPIFEVATQSRRTMMDIFESPKDDKQVKAAVDQSKVMVTEFLRKPYAVNNIMLLQRHSKGVVDHSVNVSVLSVFLGLRMGYSSQPILENLALGGLFHDIGKAMIEPKGELMEGEEDPAMQQHPKLGAELVGKMREVPNEVRLIVAQHHEYLDGSGYPAKLKGLAIYDLARLVAIANLYDEIISQSFAPTMKEKAAEAVDTLEREYQGKLDPKKLEKAIKILRYSFL